ncbi:MAG: aromatic ring hydroxylase [Candidatus Nephthysia bennettiae]|nr:MAG: aromatic ring hydroxylase [Candidatus Dormibacteraeota bacterium]
MSATIAPITRAAVLQRLGWIMDPELGLDIVTLGLIYGVTVSGATVHVTMTLTTRGCPLHEIITTAVHDALQWMEAVDRVDLEIVWDPPWHPAMIDPTARI